MVAAWTSMICLEDRVWKISWLTGYEMWVRGVSDDLQRFGFCTLKHGVRLTRVGRSWFGGKDQEFSFGDGQWAAVMLVWISEERSGLEINIWESSECMKWLKLVETHKGVSVDRKEVQDQETGLLLHLGWGDEMEPVKGNEKKLLMGSEENCVLGAKWRSCFKEDESDTEEGSTVLVEVKNWLGDLVMGGRR